MSYSAWKKWIRFTIIFVSVYAAIESRAETLAERLPGTNSATTPVEEPVASATGAQDSDSVLPVIPFDDYQPEGAFFTWLDRQDAGMTSIIESMAKSMDDYLSDSPSAYSSSGSYLRIRQSLTFYERGKIDTPTAVSFKLRLPNTEKKLKLFFETPEEKNPYDISTKTTETPPATVVGKSDYALGVQGESGERFGWKYKPTLGANIDSGVDPFLRFRFTKAIPFATWDINWQETPQWYNSLGWGVDSYFEINKRLSANALFRSATFGGWVYNTDNTDLSHVFSVFHTLDDKKHISYYTGVYGVTQPMIYTTEFLVGITYRQDLHKNYLFFEVEPQIHYLKTNRFHPEHSLTFRLEMLFKR